MYVVFVLIISVCYCITISFSCLFFLSVCLSISLVPVCLFTCFLSFSPVHAYFPCLSYVYLSYHLLVCSLCLPLLSLPALPTYSVYLTCLSSLLTPYLSLICLVVFFPFFICLPPSLYVCTRSSITRLRNDIMKDLCETHFRR